MDKIFYHGDFISMCGLEIEAILVRDGKIFKVGTESDVFKEKNSQTLMVDLKGATLLPAFLDSHSHLSALAQTLLTVSLEKATSFEEIKDALIAYKETHALEAGEWIIGFGYDHNFLSEKTHPTCDLLDLVARDHPILITHISGHMGVVNHCALKVLGIDENSVDPEGGVIGRKENSSVPNGYLEEKAFLLVSQKMPAPPLKKVMESLSEAQKVYLAHGITTVQDGLLNDSSYSLLYQAAKEKIFQVDVIGYVDIKSASHLMDDHRELTKDYFNHFRLGGYKLILDGSPQGKTAWLSQPYEKEKDYRGYAVYCDQEVASFVEKAIEEELPLLTHCNGDAASQQLIEAFEQVMEKYPLAKTNRPVMIHAQTVRKDQLERMKKLEMIPSYFIGHTYFWGDIHEYNLGSRAYHISPVRTTIALGMPYTFHQDTPVIAPDMIFTLWCAVNRMTKEGKILGKEECVTPYEALKGVTIYPAYQYFEEDRKGTLEVGKLADFVILDQNPLKVNPMDIKKICVLATVKEGETLYSLAHD